LGLYQIMPLLVALMGRARRFPLTVPVPNQSLEYCWLILDRFSIGPRGFKLLAKDFTAPGLGRIAISGRFPAWIRVCNTAFKSRVPVKFTLPPVVCCQGATIAMKLSCSELPQTPSTSTLPIAWAAVAEGKGKTPPGEAEGEGDATALGEAEAEGIADTEGEATALGKAEAEGFADTEGEATALGEAEAEGFADTEGEAETLGAAVIDGAAEITGREVLAIVGAVVPAVGLDVVVHETEIIRIKATTSTRRNLPEENFFILNLLKSKIVLSSC
jgi:hypothetical protein